MSEPSDGYVAECFWVGVTDEDLRSLDHRAAASAEQRSRGGEDVRYLGSVLMRQDEVVLCFFEGAESSVRKVAEAAEIPFERILETSASPRAAANRRPESASKLIKPESPKR
jgi:hypothetical protein